MRLTREALEGGLTALTPVEERGGRFYKREDKFAPSGYGGVNGSKLRQLVHLYRRAHAAGKRGIVTGSSVLSPQSPMAAAVASAYGVPCKIILGGTRPETALRHVTVQMAQDYGASFTYVEVGYNPFLQAAVKRKAEEEPQLYRLNYGITTEAGCAAGELETFHAVGAAQVENVPEGIEEVLLPFGSGNSAVSVLYGLSRRRPRSLRAVTLFGIGPLRLEWAAERLRMIEELTGVPALSSYRAHFPLHASLEGSWGEGPLELRHVDLHTSRYARYGDRKRFSGDGITFHPTYEGKILSYIRDFPQVSPEFSGRTGKALLWIVGSEPGVIK